MCGRFTLTIELSTLIKVFQAHLQNENYNYSRRYNIAPSQNIPVVILAENQREISMMRWGLIPHWAKDASIGSKLINARAETIGQKSAFKYSFLHRRCLIPADGFYEWRKQSGGKTPIRITLPGKEVFAFAGIWASGVPRKVMMSIRAVSSLPGRMTLYGKFMTECLLYYPKKAITELGWNQMNPAV
ncbi:MAG: putative SOS response-associated peptidase YedK [Pelotomaculum sp. PtaU1.Bin035]|nr:MAG: putative SOS response-associated peptidase YedK [Pelotomaculum sp. PtaU1.Bin035]